MRTTALIFTLLLPTAASAVEVELTPGADVRALTASLQAGATYTFREGVYEIEGDWNITGEGTESAPIVFRAGRGERPVIRLVTSGSRSLRIADSSHVVVQGLTFEHDDERFGEVNGNGIRIENSADIRIDDCVVRKTGGTAIAMVGDVRRVRVTATEIHGTRDGNGIYAGCGDASCWLQGGEIEGNLIYDINGRDEEIRMDGIHLAPGAQDNRVVDNILVGINRHGIVFHSAEYGAQNIAEGNAVWDTGASGMWISGAALIRNNVVFDTGAHGLYSEDNREALENLVVSHNTFVRTGRVAVFLRGWEGKTGMVLANNAIANPLGEAVLVDRGGLDLGIHVAGNVVTGSVNGVDLAEIGGFLPGGGYQDFFDIDERNFYPRSVAVLRDAADPSSASFVPALDFSGFGRNGDRPTVGAFEYVHPNNPGWRIDAAFKDYVDTRIDDEFTQRGCCRRDADPASAAFVPLVLLAVLGRRRRR